MAIGPLRGQALALVSLALSLPAVFLSTSRLERETCFVVLLFTFILFYFKKGAFELEMQNESRAAAILYICFFEE